ncbi:hypothetical protein L596_003836 [Steinernema carpocapsae]|uniref:Uncharacterized protein n=1 Tax=Steinernema carpocapsae TaxID=34508 RepID=A0A4U8UUW6_STECR|nr:hypothetical protein L596_003836 [Steinernema carpocapsae]
MTLQPSYSCSFISPDSRRAPLSVASNPVFTQSDSTTPPASNHYNNSSTTNNNNNNFSNINNNNNNDAEPRPPSPPPSLGNAPPSTRGEILPNGRLGTDPFHSRLCSLAYDQRKPTHFLFPSYQIYLMLPFSTLYATRPRNASLRVPTLNTVRYTHLYNNTAGAA